MAELGIKIGRQKSNPTFRSRCIQQSIKNVIRNSKNSAFRNPPSALKFYLLPSTFLLLISHFSVSSAGMLTAAFLYGSKTFLGKFFACYRISLHIISVKTQLGDCFSDCGFIGFFRIISHS